MTIDPRTPVVVGVAQAMQKPDDLSQALEAIAMMEQAVRDQLKGTAPQQQLGETERNSMPFAPVPFWLQFGASQVGDTAPAADETKAPPPAAATSV